MAWLLLRDLMNTDTMIVVETREPLKGASQMFCPQCGSTQPVELKFCKSCGVNLETVRRAAAMLNPHEKIERERGISAKEGAA